METPDRFKTQPARSSRILQPLKQQPETLASGLLWGRRALLAQRPGPLPSVLSGEQRCSPPIAAGRRQGSDHRATPPACGSATPVSTGARFSRRGRPGPPGDRGMPARGKRREPGRRQQGPARPAPFALPQGHSRSRRDPARMRERKGAAGPPHSSAPGAAPSPTMCSPGSEWSWCPDRWSPPVAPAPSGPTRP